MRVYWRDRKGNAPPPDAVFSHRPFSLAASATRLESVVRVDALPLPAMGIKVVRRRFLPDKKEWVSAVGQALEAIRDKEIEKVVLARCCVLECAEEPDPFAVTAALKERAQNSTVFCFAQERTAFLGATPEHLFIRKGDQLASEAVAGTRKRGETALEDAKLESELLASAKDLREFEPVQRYLQETLSPLCVSSLSFSPLQARKTQNVQHLYSQGTGTLRAVSDAAILDQIHPTPALCGIPKQNAFEWIGRLEPFDRGLYGGAVGWSTDDAAEWVVAIRCCLIQGKEVRLYAGAGIVEGSNPEEEWEELNLKMKLYEGIFV